MSNSVNGIQQVKEIDESKTDQILKELNEMFYDIPFGNSEFQNRYFVEVAALTPERAYRAIGLQLHNKVETLVSRKKQKRLNEIAMMELEDQIENDDSITRYEKMRLEIDLEEMKSTNLYDKKLLNDLLVECNFFYNELKKYPQYSRAQFEEGERSHYLQRLTRQASVKDDSVNNILHIAQDAHIIKGMLEKQSDLGIDKELQVRRDLSERGTADLLSKVFRTSESEIAKIED